MRNLDRKQRQLTIDRLTTQRDQLKREISSLDRDRRAWVAQRRSLEPGGPVGLDQAMVEGLRRIAEDRGFEFASGPAG